MARVDPSKRPPRWDDTDDLAGFVRRVIDDLFCYENPDQAMIEYGLKQWPYPDRGRGVVTWKMLEREAVEAAQGGNFGPLFDLLDPNHPLNHPDIDPPICKSLALSTYALIREIGSGRRKRAHRPKLTEMQRRAQSPVHDAAEEVPVVEGLLRSWYPDRTASAVHDRALCVVAHNHKVPLETLTGYVRRSKADRRRL